jgi:hypothetical protein
MLAFSEMPAVFNPLVLHARMDELSGPPAVYVKVPGAEVQVPELFAGEKSEL